MKTPIIYLSGSIASLTETEARGWRNAIKDEFPQYEYRDPARRIYNDEHADDKEIVIGDKIDMDQSDVFLVNLTQYSAGTVMEIYHGYINNKMVVVVNNMGIPDSHVSPWVSYHATIVVPSLYKGMSYIGDYYGLIQSDAR